MTSQQTTSHTQDSNVSVYVRWRPLITEEAGHEEITRTATTEGAMQRVVFSGQKCMAGTNVPAAQTLEKTPTSPRSKRMAKLAKRMRRREEKANTFNGLLHGVFEAQENNEAVFENAVKPCVEHVLNGGVGAVFSYGQTGSGKTHTILGYGEEHGLAYQAMEEMTDALKKLNREDAYVNVSFTSYHKRSVYDLLNNRNAAAARENAEGDVVFRSYTKIKDRKRDDTQDLFSVQKMRCQTAAEGLAAIQKGIQSRIVGNSNFHSQSSRSHAFLEYEMTTDKIESYKRLIVKLENEIARLVNMVGNAKPRCQEKGRSMAQKRFTLNQTQKRNQVFLDFMTPEQLETTIYGRGYAGMQKWYKWLITQVKAHIENIKTEEGECFKGKMVLVDLAGSEYGADKRNKHAKEQTAEEWQEAKQINISLAALNDVISAKHSGKKRVPYRASTLTRILRKYLADEQCKTVMIGNLSPTLKSSSKSFKTLRYCCMVAKTAKRSE